MAALIEPVYTRAWVNVDRAPLVCGECGARDSELIEPAICPLCRRLLCGWHLARDAPAPVCDACFRANPFYGFAVSEGDRRDIVQRLWRDVEATCIGIAAESIVRVADVQRRFSTGRQDYEQRIVVEVQQMIHDQFVDTTWPACPDHPNHPLWFSDGWWRCERSQRSVAQLGTLGRSEPEMPR